VRNGDLKGLLSVFAAVFRRRRFAWGVDIGDAVLAVGSAIVFGGHLSRECGVCDCQSEGLWKVYDDGTCRIIALSCDLFVVYISSCVEKCKCFRGKTQGPSGI
jgi:hypothetical protein